MEKLVLRYYDQLADLTSQYPVLLSLFLTSNDSSTEFIDQCLFQLDNLQFSLIQLANNMDIEISGMPKDLRDDWAEVIELLNALKENRLCGMTYFRRLLYGVKSWKETGPTKFSIENSHEIFSTISRIEEEADSIIALLYGKGETPV